MKRIILILCCVSMFCIASESFAQSPTISPAREAARKSLGQLGVEYSRDSFVKQAGEGDTIAVQLFLAAGMDPNSYSHDSNTALVAAASYGFTETAQALLAGGADINERGPSGSAEQ